MAQVSSMSDKLSCRETVAEKISEQAHLQSFKRNHLKKKQAPSRLFVMLRTFRSLKSRGD